MKRSRPLPCHIVEAEHNGIHHRAEYTVSGDLVTVTYGMVTMSALIHSFSAEIEARRLLRKIVEGGQWKF